MKRLRIVIAACIVVSTTIVAWSLNPALKISQYGHTAWLFEQNGLDSLPTAIAQTSDGYIWLGTGDGLLRFDGVRFTHWTPFPGEGLPTSEVVHLLGLPDGSLLIATEGGLSRLTNGHLYNYPDGKNASGTLSLDANGNAWIANSSDHKARGVLCKIGQSHLQCLETKDGIDCDSSGAIFSDRSGSIWIGDDRAICRWGPRERPEIYALPHVLKPNTLYGTVRALAGDEAGSLWGGVARIGPGFGLLKFAGGAWKSYAAAGVDGTKLPVRSLLVDRGGSLWIGTENQGLYKLSGATLHHFSLAEGLSGTLISQIFEDRENSIWVVTDRGVDMFRDLPIISYSTSEGLSDNQTLAVATSKDSSVWVGTRNSLNRLRNGQLAPMAPSRNGVTFLFRDWQNRLWSASEEQFLAVYENGSFRPISTKGQKDLGFVNDMAEDVVHQMWVSVVNLRTSRSELLRVEDNAIAERVPFSGVPAGAIITSLATKRSGGLWVGAANVGLYIFRNGNFEHVEMKQRIGSAIDVREDPDGAVWLSTNLPGYVRYNNGTTRTLSSRDGLPCDAGVTVVNDHKGRHWFYMKCGIVRITDEELERWWQTPQYRPQMKTLDVIDGAKVRPDVEKPALSPDGRIWSVGNTLEMLDTEHLPHNSLPPPIHIERLIADHRDYTGYKEARLGAAPRELEIDFTGLSFVVPERVQFRYRLLGHSKSWTDASPRRQAFYDDLPPGHYTFEVMASNNDGVWNEAGAGLSFYIPPAWYQTLWFRLLATAMLAAGTYLLYRSRLKSYSAAMKLRFNERLEERTRLAHDLHDTLLQTIQGSRLLTDDLRESHYDPAKQDRALDRLSTWLQRAEWEGRVALSSLRATITESNDLAGAFRQATEDYNSEGVDIHVSEIGEAREMHPIARDEVFRIGHEAIRNAYQHSKGTNIWVEIGYNSILTLRIRDNGCGTDLATIRAGRKDHFGLSGMRERAARIGAKLTIDSTEKCGTEVSLAVPGSAIFVKRKRWQIIAPLSRIFGRR